MVDDSRVFLLSLKESFPNLTELIVSEMYARSYMLKRRGYEIYADLTSVAARSFTISPTCRHPISRYGFWLDLFWGDFGDDTLRDLNRTAKSFFRDEAKSWDMHIYIASTAVLFIRFDSDVIHVKRPCSRTGYPIHRNCFYK
jgi:hypothetical protein